MQLVLLDFPVDAFQRARQHAAAVQRELDVLRVDGARADHLPRRSDEIVADLDARFTGYRATMDVLDGLVARGTVYADVTIPVLGDPEERARAIEALADLLDEVDAYCESGEQLLTVVTPPALRAFRAWLFREVIAQLRGAPATPWTRDDADAAIDEPPKGGCDGEPLVVCESGALDLADAGRLRESLQAAFTDAATDVIVDLTDVEFVDSVILSVLVAVHKRFAADGRRLSVLVAPDLFRLFELTGLIDVLDVRAG